jgi:hypothetical protein
VLLEDVVEDFSADRLSALMHSVSELAAHRKLCPTAVERNRDVVGFRLDVRETEIERSVVGRRSRGLGRFSSEVSDRGGPIGVHVIPAVLGDRPGLVADARGWSNQSAVDRG